MSVSVSVFVFSVEQNVFAFIADTLGKNDDFQSDPNHLLYVGVIHDVLSAFITTQHRRVRAAGDALRARLGNVGRR